MCIQHQLSGVLAGEQHSRFLHCAKVWIDGRHYEKPRRFWCKEAKKKNLLSSCSFLIC